METLCSPFKLPQRYQQSLIAGMKSFVFPALCVRKVRASWKKDLPLFTGSDKKKLRERESNFRYQAKLSAGNSVTTFNVAKGRKLN